MRCLNLNPDRDQLSRLGAASVSIPSPLTASVASGPATNARPEPTLGLSVLAAARSQACSDLEKAPHSRKRQGIAYALTHLMLMLELEARQ